MEDDFDTHADFNFEEDFEGPFGLGDGQILVRFDMDSGNSCLDTGFEVGFMVGG